MLLRFCEPSQSWSADHVEVTARHGALIEGATLVTRKGARESIHTAWGHRCAYCGADLGRSPTLDHVIPKSRGGPTVRWNLISCCLECNASKGHGDVWSWYEQQDFFCRHRQQRILDWIVGEKATWPDW